jgi:formylglycine-generating enzyme
VSETEDTPPPKSSRKPVQPLPRLWKTEPESAEYGVLPPSKDSSAKKSPVENDDAPAEPPKSPRATTKSKSKKEKVTAPGDEPVEKKVLKEDTPALDTYESRRKARMLVGGLTVACVMLFGWIIYTGFFYDPSPIVMGAEDPLSAEPVPEPRPTPDREAQFMFERAREIYKSKKTDQAIAMLNTLINVKAYKDTPTAMAAKAALDRFAKNLPLFADGPIVLAAPDEPKPAPVPEAPPTVVAVKPNPPEGAGGQASLVLPANPSEALVLPPNSALPTPTGGTTKQGKPLPNGFKANMQAGVHQSGWPFVIVGDRDGAPMVLVPGSTFTMGNDDGLPPERPAHSVRLSTYYIDEHEVTNRQFRVFLAETGHKGQPAGKWLSEEKAREPENLPVTYVNFPDANAFASWAGKEIPTEAQWEMAARSADSRRFPWGNEPLPKSKARDLRQINAVMSFPDDVSPYRVFDMAGNVQEWTRDWFDSKYYHQFAKTAAENPAGPNTRPTTQQVALRGGAKNWSVTAREGTRRDSRLSYLGFRCVLVVDGLAAGASAANPSAPAQPAPGTPPKTAPDPAAAPF